MKKQGDKITRNNKENSRNKWEGEITRENE